MEKLKYSRHLISEGTGLNGISQVLAEEAVWILARQVQVAESLGSYQTLMSMKKKPLVY